MSRNFGEAGPNSGRTTNQKFTAERKAAYIEVLANSGKHIAARTEVGVHRKTVAAHLKDDDEFAEACEDAMKQFRFSLVKEAKRRAMDGVDKPIFYHGQRTDTVKEYSDTLLLALLKANCPEFQDRQHIVAKTDNTHTVDLEAKLRSLPPEKRRQVRDALSLLEENKN